MSECSATSKRATAALVKVAAGEGFDWKDWLANGIKPGVRNTAIGLIGGGLLGGIGSAMGGGSFLGGALGGGLLGAGAGLVAQPVWDRVQQSWNKPAPAPAPNTQQKQKVEVEPKNNVKTVEENVTVK